MMAQEGHGYAGRAAEIAMPGRMQTGNCVTRKTLVFRVRLNVPTFRSRLAVAQESEESRL